MTVEHRARHGRAADALVVVLHGVGADGRAVAPLASAIAAAVPHADVLAPDGFHAFDGAPGAGRQWFSVRGITDALRPARLRAAAAELDAWLDRELARRGLAGDRLALAGFSQGGIATTYLAIHRAPRPACGVVIAGRTGDDAPIARGPAVPILIAHGDRDAMMTPAIVEASARELEARGAVVTRTTYPNVGHQLDPRQIAEAAAFVARALPERP